jgi:signal transduction histidine kinase
MPAGKVALARAAERIQPGEHLCVIYDDPEEQLATVEPFVRVGLERHEQVFYVADENTSDAVLAGLRTAGIDVDAALASHALILSRRPDSFVKSGAGYPESVVRFWRDAVGAARAHGFTTLRFLVEMSWALGGKDPTPAKLLELEAVLTSFLRQNGVLALCQYHRRRFDPAVLKGVIQTHPLVVYGSLVCENPFFVPPEEFLHPDPNADVERMLRSLAEREQEREQLRAAREQMETLSRQLVSILEAERLEVARELHDELGQLLTALTLVLERSAQAAPPPARQWLRDAGAMVSDLMRRVRELSLRLRPPMLDDLGLISALRWGVDRFQTQTGVQVELRVDEVENQRFWPEVETAAYRIVQEALTNVARHAGVKKTAVRVWVEEDALRILIEDRGGGFDSERPGAGTVGMRERAAALGGYLTIRSAPGEGTSISVSLPLAGPA